MTTPNRPQQYRLSWPLDPSQVEGMDTMFETLFKRLRAISASAIGIGLQGAQGIPGCAGEDGEDAFCPPCGPRSDNFTLGSVIFAGPSGRLAQDNAKFFWDDTNFRLGIGTAVPASAIHLLSTTDAELRLFIENSSTGVNAFSNAVVKADTTQAFLGALGPSYGAFGASRCFLDTSNVAGNGWDFIVEPAAGDHRFYTGGYSAVKERLRIATDVTLFNAAKLIQGGTALAFGTTSTDGITTQNISASTVGTPVQVSPRLRWSGTAWDTDDAVSRSVQFFMEALGVSGATVTGQLKVGFIDPVTAAITYPWLITSGGNLTITGNYNGTDFTSSGANGFQAANGAFFFWASRAAFSSPADGQVKVSNNAVSAGVLFDVATDGTLKVRNRANSADGQIAGASVRGNAVTFANVPATPVEGMLVAVTDSTTATWGAVITGTGANHVLAYYNGTNWTVAGK